MKKNIFKKIILVGALSAAAFTFAACGGNSAVVGAWKTVDGETLVLQENGNITGSGIPSGAANYKVNGNTITLYLEIEGQKMELKGTISENAITFDGIDQDWARWYKK